MAATGALAGCGGGSTGGGAATDQIRTAIIASVTLPDAATCSRVFTDAGITQYYHQDSAAAAKQDCAKDAGAQRLKDQASQLTVADINVTGSAATATATLNSKKANYKLVQQGGSWKVDGISDASGSASATTSSSSTTDTSASATTTTSAP
jgi:hypothetical protein